jgi:type 1 glutamine amidotransferase
MADLLYVTEVAPYGKSPARPDLQHRVAGAHRVLGQSATAVAELASMLGLEFRHTDNVTRLSPGSIERSRVLALFTIGETRWSDAQKELILDRLRIGKLGILALHSATDSCHEWPEYTALVGARFSGHPWTQEFEIEVADAGHPATHHLEPVFPFTDEVYLFSDLRSDARVLLRASGRDLDMSREQASQSRSATGLPLAWCFSEGAGRCFYTALGHFPSAYENVVFLGHVYGGLAWILGEDA